MIKHFHYSEIVLSTTLLFTRCDSKFREEDILVKDANDVAKQCLLKQLFPHSACTEFHAFEPYTRQEIKATLAPSIMTQDLPLPAHDGGDELLSL